jgi:DNA-directed RNA polymerase specialized sigma24 family protein
MLKSLLTRIARYRALKFSRKSRRRDEYWNLTWAAQKPPDVTELKQAANVPEQPPLFRQRFKLFRDLYFLARRLASHRRF